MPLILLRIPDRQFTKTARMPTPRRMDNLEQWLKLARKHLPEIPKWEISEQGATQEKIAFTLSHRPNKTGFSTYSQHAYITIDRTIGYL